MARKLVVEIIGDSRNLERAFKRSEQAATTFTARISRSFRGLMGLSPAFLGAAGLVAGMKYAVSAASDLNEQLNRTQVLFGKNADQVADWSKTVQASFGVGQREALAFAGAFGSVFESAGQNEQAAARMSETIVQLAGDMASFNNQSPTDMLEKLQSALAGEPEPLRRFGVNISDAAIKLEAYRDGIAKTGTQLSDQQKIVARYNFILRNTGKQQGDFTRTSDSFANVMRVLQLNLENVAIAIGKELIPYLQLGAAWLNKWLGDSKNVARIQDFVRQVLEAVGKTIDWLVGQFQDGGKGLVKFVMVSANVASEFISNWEMVSAWWSSFWRQLVGTALLSFRKIIEPFSHLPGKLGGWARKLKDEIQPQLDYLYQGFADAEDRGAKAAQDRLGKPGDKWQKMLANWAKNLKPPPGLNLKDILKGYRDALQLGPVPGLPGAGKKTRDNKATMQDWLGLAADRAEQTKGFGDDLRVLNRWHAYIRQLIHKQGMTYKLARDLFDVETRIADVQKKIADERKKNRKYQQQRVISSEQVLASLGLRLGPAQERHALQMLSMYGRGGGHWRLPPGGRSPAFAAGRGVVVNGDVHVYGVEDIGKLENKLTKRQAARAHVRRGQ